MSQPYKTRVYLYVATNKVNGKKYVGVTQQTLRHRITQHVSLAMRGAKHVFAKAIRKHGADAFDWAIVGTFMFSEDALKAEMDLIKEIGRKRLYNCTDGGVGQTGRPLSEEAKARIGAAHRGKQYRLGMTHSDETKEILRKHGKRGLARFKEYAHLGPAASAKRVVCLNDGKTFESASAAAKTYGLAKSIVIEVCNRDPVVTRLAGRCFAMKAIILEGWKKQLQNATRRPIAKRTPTNLCGRQSYASTMEEGLTAQKTQQRCTASTDLLSEKFAVEKKLRLMALSSSMRRLRNALPLSQQGLR